MVVPANGLDLRLVDIGVRSFDRLPVSHDPLRQWGRFLEIVAAVVSIGAGIYLLSKSSAPIALGGASGESWFQVIAHGIGAYIIARGLWMFAQLGVQRSANEALERLVELNGGWDSAEEPEPTE